VPAALHAPKPRPTGSEFDDLRVASASGVVIADTARKIARSLEEVRSEYLSQAQRYPWIVGYSGGKDSTLVLQLVFEMLLALPKSERTRHVHVLTNDTLVESPILAGYINTMVDRIRVAGQRLD
jgi:DNA sulfur modification protein DndC